jgi:elongation factor P--(R)-beta-lysine ligase
MSLEFPKNEMLCDRAVMLARVRDFFAERGVLEVDVPALTLWGSVDAHIDLISAQSLAKPCYLHSSPEYGMKKLLAQGIGDIYQLSHVFRDDERGSRHLPEFTMVEWYRRGVSFHDLIDETAAFTELFVGSVRREQWTYREALRHFAGVDYLKATDRQLMAALPCDPPEVDRQGLLSLVLALCVEPALPSDVLVSIIHFPADQAALAQARWLDGEHVAERFELFFGGLELANGYHELADPKEQRRRLVKANYERISLGKPPYPIDEDFLRSLASLPDCCGVAVGFDRLMMARHKIDRIQEVAISALQ